MPIPRGRRCAFLGVVLAATSGCSFLVSTSGLTGGDDGGVTLTDDSGILLSEAGTTGNDDAGEPGAIGDAGTYPVVDSSIDAAGAPGVDGGGGGGPSDAGHDAGGGDAGNGAKGGDGGCTNDLSNIGTGDFQISLTLRTAQAGKAAIANQRTSCSPGVFWDLRLVSGQPDLELDGTAGYSELIAAGPDLDDGATHTIIAARVSGTTTIIVDGTVEGTSGSGAGVALTALPSLAEGTDVCDGVNGDGGDGTVAIPGAVSNLCVSSL